MTTCDRCGFDAAEWNDQDATRTLSHVDLLLDLWLADTPPGLARRLESRRTDVLGAVEADPGLIGSVHHLWHGLVSIADQRRLADDAVPTATGIVAGLHVSDGGVPKKRVESSAVGRRGLAGDRQATRLHHGRPWQALCLWSAEAIESFVADGHPIVPGAAGENVTVSGLDWESLRAGTILQIGEVTCQLSAPATPCKKNAQWFTDGDFGRMDVDRDPASTRWYASVIGTGSVAVGDVVTLSP